MDDSAERKITRVKRKKNDGNRGLVIGIGVVILIVVGVWWDNVSSNPPAEKFPTATSQIGTQNEVDALQQEIQTLKNNQATSTDKDYSTITAEWKDRVAEVICAWDYTNGQEYERDQASGLLVDFQGLGTTIITNRHVILDANGYSPNWCRVGIYGKGSRLVGRNGNDSPFLTDQNRDWAYIKLGAQYDLPDDPANRYGQFDDIVSRNLDVCKADASLGDEIVVLGYPTIGTQGGITVTKGIISGIEGDFYVTDAKIDHGNSGGAAILVKEDCYLGIPTWVDHVDGGYESLGRVLKSNFFFGK